MNTTFIQDDSQNIFGTQTPIAQVQDVNNKNLKWKERIADVIDMALIEKKEKKKKKTVGKEDK